MEYDLELNKVIKEIKRIKAKLVCVQLPDGLKPKATEIVKLLEEKTKAKIVIWADTCFGACDYPLELEKYNFDLLVQFGHTKWKKIT